MFAHSLLLFGPWVFYVQIKIIYALAGGGAATNNSNSDGGGGGGQLELGKALQTIGCRSAESSYLKLAVHFQ